jgi:hypothetical protein
MSLPLSNYDRKDLLEALNNNSRKGPPEFLFQIKPYLMPFLLKTLQEGFKEYNPSWPHKEEISAFIQEISKFNGEAKAFTASEELLHFIALQNKKNIQLEDLLPSITQKMKDLKLTPSHLFRIASEFGAEINKNPNAENCDPEYILDWEKELFSQATSSFSEDVKENMEPYLDEQRNLSFERLKDRLDL